MSYDVSVDAKVDGCDKYVIVACPEFDSPSFNYTYLFQSCMDWEFEQFVEYPATQALEKINKGINELEQNTDHYINNVSKNGEDDVDGVYRSLQSFLEALEEAEKEYPLSCLYFSW